MRVCLAIVTDLIFATRIRSAAEQAGWRFHQARSALQWEQGGEGEAPVLVLADMNAEGIESAEAIRYSRAHWPGARIVAYFAHVQSELRERAREAGADDVMPRSQFVAVLQDLFT